MAKIGSSAEEKVFQLREFYGLNENPDGDTKLKYGEAAVMKNFCVTRDGNLRKRPGTKTLLNIAPGKPIVGFWHGRVHGREEFLAAAGDTLWRLWDDEYECFICEALGAVNTERRVNIFAFGGNAYILDGTQYLCYDGLTLDSVEGYRPLVAISAPPDGGGEMLEGINRLNGKRRMWFSPDGEQKTFVLPEKDIRSIDYVLYAASGEPVDRNYYIADTSSGTVEINFVPERGINSIEIGWTVNGSGREEIEHMHFSELYNGSTDARVFLYSENSNRAYYSGLDYDGRPRADYFPELNIMDVGDSNTGITGMLRHYSRMMVFKTDSAWSVQYGSTQLADGLNAAAFYVTPVNRSIGCSAPGQIQLVLNSPYCLYGGGIYEWKNNNAYWENITVDERQVRRISDRVYASLSDFDEKQCVCYDDNPAQEYYVCCGDRALVYNYAVDAWYEYTGLDITSIISFRGKTYLGTADGRLLHLGGEYLSDDGDAIHAYWESGSMSFDEDFRRKYSAMLWVGTLPQDSGEIYVTVQTDRKSCYTEKLVSSALSSFRRWNFTNLSFRTNRKPTVTRLKIKAKKFVFYKLIFESSTADTAATVLSADIRVRYTGYTK